MNRQPLLRFPLHIVIIYCLTGAAWILFSDLLVVQFFPADYHGIISIAKGWLFVSVTAAILALLLRRYQRTQAGLERRMREIIDNLPSILYVFDRDGRAVLCNRAMVTLFGLDGSDYRGMSREELGISPEAAAAHRANDRRVFETGQAVIAEEEERHGDGRHTYLTTKFPLTADDGSIEAVCGISTDITERKLIEEALRESEARYRNLILYSPDAILINRQDSVILANNACLNLFGATEERDLIGKSPFELFHPDFHTQIRTRIHRLRELGEAVPPEQEKIIRLDGSCVDVEVLAAPFNAGGEIDIHVILRDITAQKLAEEERGKLQQQLNQSQKMEALGQLAGGVAHDFNNILSVIMGYGHMLKMGTGLDLQQQEKVDHIITAAEKAAQLTGGLLAFSRKQILASNTISLNDLVQHLQKFLARVIGEDIQLQTHLAMEKLPVNIDSGQIEQALINLATNARDAMPQGGLLTIETSRQEVDNSFVQAHGYGQAGSYAVITLADTGCGMDNETRKKIFEPFFTTKESGKGTGLGLAIVYGIVKQHNGFINVYSEVGKGTICRIYLPLVPEADRPGEVQTAPPPPRRGVETILVAEDEPTVRTLVTGILTDYGYDVLLAGDGTEAIEQFVSHRDRIALVLMDMIMPRLSGKAAADEIQRLQPGTKILFASGYTADFIRNRGVEEEGIALIMKPFQPLELLRKVREILDT